MVPIECLADEWPKVQQWIERAIEEGQGDEGVLDVFIGIARGAYSLWVGKSFAVVAQVVRHPRQTVATILYCGGTDLTAISDAFDFAKDYARANAIDVLRVWGRPGWAKVLGLKAVGSILQLEVV